MPVGILDPQQRVDPIPNFGFAVQMGSSILGWFTEIGALSFEREVKTHSEGGVNDYIHQLPGRLKRSNVTLKHGLAGNELWAWFQKGMYDGKVEGKNISIVLYNSELAEVRRWDLVNVYPAKWTGSNLNSSSQELSVESIEFASVGTGASGSAVQRTQDDSDTKAVNPDTSPQIDVPALANKVYQLLKQELKLERERLG